MFSRQELYGPDGSLLWCSNGSASSRATTDVTHLPEGSHHAVVADLLGISEDTRRTSLAEIMAESERLDLLSRRGCLPGFITVLPRGAFLHQAIEAVNEAHAARLDATRMEFPLVFDRRDADMASLTGRYEHQERMFRLHDASRQLRLSYAADPGLFAWLRGRRLHTDRLPYVIYTPMPAFRRRRSGETDLLTLNQYTLPDFHALCVEDEGYATYTWLLREAATTSRFFFGESWAHFLEIAPDLAARYPHIAGQLASVAGQFTVARYATERTRYFALKGGIDVSCGAGPVMLFNFQWDDTNGEKFDFRTLDGQAVTVIHSTLAGGWPKVLPTVVGQALAGWTPREMPVELTPDPVTVLPVEPRNTGVASGAVDNLRRNGVPAILGEGGRRSVGARVHRLRQRWGPFHTVAGDREAAGAPLTIIRTVNAESFSAETFVSRFRDRLDICRHSSGRWRDLPFTR